MEFPDIYCEPVPGQLCQGDLFRSFDDDIFPEVNSDYKIFIILTYTCDLANPKGLQRILISPVFQLNIIIDQLQEKHGNKEPHKIQREIIKRIKELSEYRRPFFFFLSPRLEFSHKPAFIDLTQISTISSEYQPKIITTRFAAIKSPWREKLGYMMGYMFNRVALEYEASTDDLRTYFFPPSDS
ncbi:MAG: hypothetical protein GF411_05935 [Candidatus Lokiarchaeota archaeon]|nr:hypothetical protein [Candidatus Lokiarchaeota archaeon]